MADGSPEANLTRRKRAKPAAAPIERPAPPPLELEVVPKEEPLEPVEKKPVMRTHDDWKDAVKATPLSTEAVRHIALDDPQLILSEHPKRKKTSPELGHEALKEQMAQLDELVPVSSAAAGEERNFRPYRNLDDYRQDLQTLEGEVGVRARILSRQIRELRVTRAFTRFLDPELSKKQKEIADFFDQALAQEAKYMRNASHRIAETGTFAELSDRLSDLERAVAKATNAIEGYGDKSSEEVIREVETSIDEMRSVILAHKEAEFLLTSADRTVETLEDTRTILNKQMGALTAVQDLLMSVPKDKTLPMPEFAELITTHRPYLPDELLAIFRLQFNSKHWFSNNKPFMKGKYPNESYGISFKERTRLLREINELRTGYSRYTAAYTRAVLEGKLGKAGELPEEHIDEASKIS